MDDTVVFLRESIAWQLEGHPVEEEIRADEEMLDLCFLAESLADGVDVQNRRYRLRTFANCFLGNEAVDWLMVHAGCSSRKEAVALGSKMQAAGLLSHVTNDHRFQDKALFFRFKADSTSTARNLNEATLWPGASTQNAGEVAADLLGSLLDLLLEHRMQVQTGDFSLVDTPAWLEFERSTAELQRVKVISGDQSAESKELLVFWVNCFHLMMLHGTIRCGGRRPLSFWQVTSYNIGGETFSLAEVEYCLLRYSSAKPTFFGSSVVLPTLKKGSHKAKYAVKMPNPFLTFFLSHGVKYNPPVAVFEPHNFDEQMAAVVRAYLEELLFAKASSSSVLMPPFFCYYYKDIGDSRAEAVRALVEYLPEAMQKRVSAVLDNNGKVKDASVHVKFKLSLFEGGPVRNRSRLSRRTVTAI